MWFAFVSPKILRWFAPFLLLTLLVATITLLDIAGYRWLFGGQSALYLLAALGFLAKNLRRNYLVYVPYYFTMVNLAAFKGFFRFLTLREQVLWEIVER